MVSDVNLRSTRLIVLWDFNVHAKVMQDNDNSGLCGLHDYHGFALVDDYRHHTPRRSYFRFGVLLRSAYW